MITLTSKVILTEYTYYLTILPDYHLRPMQILLWLVIKMVKILSSSDFDFRVIFTVANLRKFKKILKMCNILFKSLKF